MFYLQALVKKNTAPGKGHMILLLAFCASVVPAPSACIAGVAPDSKPVLAGRPAPARSIAETRTAASTNAPAGTEGVWDASRYISLDEVRAGSEAYCLTEYGAAGIERFGLEVIDVVRGIEPGRDAILVVGTDERFIHTGPVGGCSGSPVYIDGRLAGALAFAWSYSKDPIYGVTPIEEMLRVGRKPGGKETLPRGRQTRFAFDFSMPLDFAEIDRQISERLVSSNSSRAGMEALPCPLMVSGLPPAACRQIADSLEPLGFMVVPGIGGALADATNMAAGDERKLVPGACLAVPVVSGDITMGAYGTVTEVRGDSVYGFGHSFLGYGPVDLPMATAKVHTVLTSIVRSSKLCSIADVVGALTIDEGAAVIGQVGQKAKTFPLSISIERYNDPERRAYKCRVAHNRILTPPAVRSVVGGAALVHGDLPPDHVVEYKATIGVEGFEPIQFRNVSTSLGVMEIAAEASAAIGLLMDNPFQEAEIEFVDYEIRIQPKSIISHIWSADLSDDTVKPGGRIHLSVVLESVRTQKRKYSITLPIPENLKPGKYQLMLCGSRDYEQFLLKAAPYRFVAQSLPDLVATLNKTLQIKRAGLYCLLVLPPGGIAVEKSELPDLPPTKALVLQDAKRMIRSQPYQHWLEKSVDTNTIVIDKKTAVITVKR
ncbi:MAG: hypothetical protein JSU94_09405 [Phycisphaerales bacterium]|nr:MAG: hypothetical protein JSU94_09405 [Phycisphaerales bacterium]